MKFIPSRLADVIIIEPEVHGDHRGFFMETWRAEAFARAGIDLDFVQDNHSKSKQGILRGLHYQLQQAQGKLIRVVAGEIYDVAVDIRKESPDFGKWVGVTLSADNKRSLWVPPGFAHGFYVSSEFAEVTYRCTDYYAPEYERSLRWDDPTLNIDWPVRGEVILSDKDKNAPLLADAQLTANN
ncbi:MAG: dTDP-4-dehydrorhamnose 3,5-epimerase [Pseudohongiellaceae bacterium]